IGSGSIRVKQFGPVVTLSDLVSCFPYDDSIQRFSITGAQLKRIFSHFMRSENRDGEGECYQVNQGVEAVYLDKERKLLSLKIEGKIVEDRLNYTLGIQGYHFNNSAQYLNITNEELLTSGKTKVLTTSAQEVLKEFLRNNQNIGRKIEQRLVYV
ncbi:bifunctional metallophosphatase/5'-nucleotidase, partial [Candidatus Roizmanbacteria bacterium CG09_land_8_20_14_0_10_41_9]